MYLKLVLVYLSVLNLNKVFAKHDEIVPTTKTYDLQVPGSDPIRIIEAEPLWGRNPQDTIVTTSERPWSDVEHRAFKPKITTTPFHTKTSISNPNTESDEGDTDEDTHDSSEELSRFLKSYAEHLKRTKTPTIDFDYDSSERFHKVELITKPSDEPTNRLASLYLDSDDNHDGLDLVDKTKGWNLMNSKRHKHPFDDKNGWVSLEVVPWSVSKVAKWHSSAKPTIEEKPWQHKYSDHSTSDSIPKPVWNYQHSHFNKPTVSYNPSPPNYFSKPFNYGSANMENKPDPRPGFSLPSATYGQKVYLQQDYSDEIPRPPWTNKKPQNVYYNPQDSNEENCEHGPSGIITDGLPPNFPKPTYEHNNRRKGSMSDEDRPSSHPFNGDGEWVLLTTTKGYKAPNARQRSLDIDTAPDHEPESISTHKSVRLTVLPPLKDSKINMTTSHGGLLQVESTFETVDQAQEMALKKENLKKKPPRRRPIKQTAAHVAPTSSTVVGTVKPTSHNKKKLSNASSVLAAVGAGMIPATMAMLVPMAMGRRRKRDIMFSTRSPDVLGLEIQLPRSL